MRVTLLLLAVGLSVAAAAPSERIVGGANAVIANYRFAASLLYSRTGVGTFAQSCGGAIISNRAILTAAYCLDREPVNRWRVRVGSARTSTGGVLHTTMRTVVHPNYNAQTANNDIAILITTGVIAFSSTANTTGIASANYNLPDNQVVTAIGWGLLSNGGQLSDSLRRVEIWTVNRNTCRTRYAEQGYGITDNMVCAGHLDVGGRGQCVGDVGSPLIHGNANTIVGVFSFSHQCGLPRYPGVNTFVPRYTSWITTNARP